MIFRICQDVNQYFSQGEETMKQTRIEIWDDVDEHLRRRDQRGEVIADLIIGGALTLIGWGVISHLTKGKQGKQTSQ
jgi:hypothetical protein